MNHEKFTALSADPAHERRACVSHISFFSGALHITSMPRVFVGWTNRWRDE